MGLLITVCCSFDDERVLLFICVDIALNTIRNDLNHYFHLPCVSELEMFPFIYLVIGGFTANILNKGFIGICSDIVFVTFTR